MKKVIFVLYRKEDLSHLEFIDGWEEIRHVALVERIPGLIKWIQNPVVLKQSEDAPDGIGEMWFDNEEAIEVAMNSPEMEAASEDAKKFIDMSKTQVLGVIENEVFS